MTNIATDIQNTSSMKSKEVIAELAGRMGWTSKEVTEMLSALGSAIGTKLMEGDSVNLSAFGQFDVRKEDGTYISESDQWQALSGPAQISSGLQTILRYERTPKRIGRQ